MLCRYNTARLGILTKIFSKTSGSEILLSVKSREEILGHSSRPSKSDRPLRPILFLLRATEVSFGLLCRPFIVYNMLSVKLRFPSSES